MLRVIEGKIQGGIEVTGRRGRRRRKLLDDLKERRGYSNLKEETLDRTMWTGFGKGSWPVLRQTTEWMNDEIIRVWIVQMHFVGNTQNFYFNRWYITYSYHWDLNGYGITKSVVSTIAMLGTGRHKNHGLIPGWGKKCVCSPKLADPSLEPTHFPFQRAAAVVFLGVNLTTNLYLEPGLRMSGVVSTLLHVSLCCTQGQIYVYLQKNLSLRRLMSYIYGAPILDVSRSHTTTQHSR